MPRQQWRKFRKWLGFPASAEVGIVSALLRDLKDVAEDVLGFEVTSGGASVPWYPAVYDEDIGDAFDYLGVEYLQIIWYKFLRTYLTYDDMVALAGHNLALCSDIKNASTCWDGSLRDNYFIVHYSKHEIRMDLIITYNMGAYDFYPSTRRIPELGSDHIGDAYYWLSLRYQLLMWEYLLAVYRPSAIILTGESVQEPGFRQCVLESMIEMFGIAVPPILDDDPEYVQAKGVAELLRRRRYLPEPTRPSSARTGLRGVDKPSEGQVPLDL